MARQQFIVNVEVAVTREEAFLLAERAATEDHAAGHRSLIGGKIDPDPPDEIPVEATLRRELHEEVGVEVDALAYVTSGYFVDDGGTPVINLVFLGRWSTGVPRVREPEEIAAVSWYDATEVTNDETLTPWTRGYLVAAEERREELGW
jgi:8-oxo-dGTP diphosphatase